MLLFHRDCTEPAQMWLCWSILREQGWEEHWESPRPCCVPLCCIPALLQVLLLHHGLKWGPKSPICCQDSGFLSQQHLLIMEPVAYSRFPSAQWLWPQNNFFLRTRLKLLLCFLCKLTLQLLSRWNIHVPRHPSSLCRDWMCVWIDQWCDYCSLQ